MDKKKIIRNVIIISIVVLIIGILIFSYAMFSSKSTSENSTKLGNLDVEYIDGEEVTVDNLLPIGSDEVEEKSSVFNFSVENKSDSYAYYDINLVDIDLPTALKDLTLKWRLMKDNEIVNEGNFLEIENTKYYLKRSIGINGKDINKYKLQIWIENSNKIDQSYMLNRSGSFKIQIEARQKLAKSPKEEITVISNTTNGNLEDLKIYGNTIDGKNVGDNKTINISVFQNLVDNGLGELGNNTNFSQLTYNKEKYKSLGSFTYSEDTYRILSTNKDIAINIQDNYITNMCARAEDLESTYTSGIMEMDIDKLRMLAYNTSYYTSPPTFLTQDLEDGDDTIYLDNISNFTNNPNAPAYKLGLIFWNYVDSRGFNYPKETYSRNSWLDLFTYDNIIKENNTIKLNVPWNHGTFKAGTLVSQTTGGSIYNYALFNTKHLTLDYKCYTKNYFDGTNGTAKIKMPTKFIKWVTIHNNSYTFGAKSHYSRIIIRKNENIQNITIDMNGHEPLRSIDDTRDYIDYKNKRIVRLINSDGSIKSKPEYEPITLPEIKTYDGNTIIESNDEASPLFQAYY